MLYGFQIHHCTFQNTYLEANRGVRTPEFHMRATSLCISLCCYVVGICTLLMARPRPQTDLGKGNPRTKLRASATRSAEEKKTPQPRNIGRLCAISRFFSSSIPSYPSFPTILALEASYQLQDASQRCEQKILSHVTPFAS